jgi:pimeloyl-ACP methyl ester carboxylesterase
VRRRPGYAWRKVVPTLVAAGYQVIVPDYRGAGASTKPRDGYDKWTMAGDLHHLVHNELGIDRPLSVVGHDLGSMVAFGYALRYRNDVVSLTTMEAPLHGWRRRTSWQPYRPIVATVLWPRPLKPRLSLTKLMLPQPARQFATLSRRCEPPDHSTNGRGPTGHPATPSPYQPSIADDCWSGESRRSSPAPMITTSR